MPRQKTAPAANAASAPARRNGAPIASRQPPPQRSSTRRTTPPPTAAAPPPRPAILVLGGSFNPVHAQHIHVLRAAKRHLESRQGEGGGGGFRVLAGYCAVTTQDYLDAKCARANQKAMAFRHRAELVRMAMENPPKAAVKRSAPGADHGFIGDDDEEGVETVDVDGDDDDSWLASPRVPHTYTPHVSARKLGLSLRRRWLLACGVADVAVVVVWGSDTVAAGRHRFWLAAQDDGVYNAVVGRAGQMAALVARRDREEAVPGAKRWNAILCASQGEVGDMSSTRLRAVLGRLHAAQGRAGKEVVAREIVVEGFLSEEQVRYIIDNEEDLYA